MSMSLMLSFLNYRGLTVVGHTITTSILAIVIPFVLLCLLSIPYVEPTNWGQVSMYLHSPTIDYAPAGRCSRFVCCVRQRRLTGIPLTGSPI